MTSTTTAGIQWCRFRAYIAAMLPAAAFGTVEFRRKALGRLEKYRSVPRHTLCLPDNAGSIHAVEEEFRERQWRLAGGSFLRS